MILQSAALVGTQLRIPMAYQLSRVNPISSSQAAVRYFSIKSADNATMNFIRAQHVCMNQNEPRAVLWAKSKVIVEAMHDPQRGYLMGLNAYR